MAGPATFAAYKLIRDLWPQRSVYDEIFRQSPTLGIFKKDTSFGERIRNIGVGISPPQGVSPQFGIAKQFKSATKSYEFQVQKRTLYGNFSIEGLLWRTFKFTGNKAILVDPLSRDSKLLMRQMQNRLSKAIHGDGSGAIGRMTSGSTPTSSATITLDTAADLRNFEINSPLQTESTGGTGGSVNDGYVTVAKVGTAASPTIQVDQATWKAGIFAVAASDFIYPAGGYNAMPFLGLGAWFPAHTGAPADFLNVTRADHADKLAGWSIVATTMSPRQRIMRLSRIVADAKGTADTYLMSTRNWEMLANELENSGRLKLTKVPAASVGKMELGVTYEGIEMVGPSGRLDVLPDPWMDDTVERCFERDAFTIASLGDLLHWDDDATPSNPMLEDAADSREIRAVGDMACYSEQPWCFARATVTAAT